MTLLHCPECMSARILVYEETAWDVNKFEIYCHSIKIFDADAKACCQDCDWTGQQQQLEGWNEFNKDS